MDAPFVRSPYNYDVMAASDESALDFSDSPSLTKQSFADECDINTIVRNFGLTGELPSNVRPPQYGDFIGVVDYQTALNAVIAADDAFMEMPAEVRARFHNDPASFVDFCSNPDNKDEMLRLGLAVAPEAPEAPPVASEAPPSP